MDDVLDLSTVAVEGICQTSQAFTGRIGHADVQDLPDIEARASHGLWPPQHTGLVNLPLALPKDVYLVADDFVLVNAGVARKHFE